MNERTRGEWFVVDNDQLYFETKFGKYHVIIREHVGVAGIKHTFVADLGTRTDALRDAIEIVRLHNAKVKKELKSKKT